MEEIVRIGRSGRPEKGDRRPEKGRQMTEQLTFDFLKEPIRHPLGIADRYFTMWAGPTEADRVEYVRTYLAEVAYDEQHGLQNIDMPF